jgi:hypothetical protein
MRRPSWFARLRSPPAGEAWCVRCSFQGGMYTGVLSADRVHQHIENHYRYDPPGQLVRLKIGGIIGRIRS